LVLIAWLTQLFWLEMEDTGNTAPGLRMHTHVEFRSDRFPAVDGEQELINRGLWGKRLADFLRDGLRGHGFETNEPIAENWGWLVPVVNKSFSLWIGCGRYQEYDNGFLCFIEPHTPFIRKFFRKIDSRERILSLQQAMDKSSCGRRRYHVKAVVDT